MNLVPNGNFNSLDGWLTSDPACVSLSTDSADGAASVVITSDPNHEDGAESTSIWQMLDISTFNTSSEYRLKFRARSDHFGPEYVLFIGMMQGEQLPVAVGYEWRQVGTQWQDVQVDFRDLNPTTTAIKLVIQVKAPDRVWISELCIEELPAGTIGAEERLLTELPAYEGSSQYVQITSDKRFMLHGKPFFPIGMWGIDYPSENALDDLQAYGFNMTGTGHFHKRGPAGVKLFLDQVQARGLVAIGVMWYALSPKLSTSELEVEMERINGVYTELMKITSTHPALFAYDIGDEVAWAGNDISSFAKGAHFIREHDPNHPIFTCAAPRGSIASLRRYDRFVDIGGSDIYPYWDGGPDQHSDLPNKTMSVVGDECVKSLEAMGGNKPVIMTPQAFGWSEGRTQEELRVKGYPYPPYHIQRFMVFDAIVNGATGIFLYQDQRYHDDVGNCIDARVKPISMELRSLHDVLAAPSELSGAKASDDRVMLLIKLHNGKRTMIAVNRSEQPLSCHIPVPVATAPWRELYSHRLMEVTDQIFTDEFGSWGVNIYEQG